MQSSLNIPHLHHSHLSGSCTLGPSLNMDPGHSTGSFQSQKTFFHLLVNDPNAQWTQNFTRKPTHTDRDNTICKNPKLMRASAIAVKVFWLENLAYWPGVV
mmetsp:Transcript_20797/g.33947  ORF Transcript_20797/g.33947 Transcript_20797/m.33947 type:complete len:101 (+) Transcript_20797:4235-4537(+)